MPISNTDIKVFLLRLRLCMACSITELIQLPAKQKEHTIDEVEQIWLSAWLNGQFTQSFTCTVPRICGFVGLLERDTTLVTSGHVTQPYIGETTALFPPTNEPSFYKLFVH